MITWLRQLRSFGGVSSHFPRIRESDLFFALAVLTTGQLVSNVVHVTFDPKFTWYRTGMDFEGNMGRRLRAQLFEAARSSLAKPGTSPIPHFV